MGLEEDYIGVVIRSNYERSAVARQFDETGEITVGDREIAVAALSWAQALETSILRIAREVDELIASSKK